MNRKNKYEALETNEQRYNNEISILRPSAKHSDIVYGKMTNLLSDISEDIRFIIGDKPSARMDALVELFPMLTTFHSSEMPADVSCILI